MANYEGNRIRCNTKTKNALYKRGVFNGEKYETIDFDKALDSEIGTFDGVYCSKIKKIGNDSWDISFETRTYTSLETIYSFIKKYKEAEWWICYEFCENYHFYWYDGEVVEDVLMMTEEEGEEWQKGFDAYCDAEEDDKNVLYPVIIIPKIDQKKYINFRIDKNSKNFIEYKNLVNSCAKKIVKSNNLRQLKNYDYEWTGGYRHYRLVSSVREILINDFKIDTKKYKMNQMADEVVNEIESIVFPFSMSMQNAIYGFVLGEQVGLYSNKYRLRGFKITDIDENRVFNNRFGKHTKFLFDLLECIKSNKKCIDLNKIEYMFINNYKKDFNELQTLIAMIPLAFIECSNETVNKYISIFTNNKKIKCASLIYYENLKCAIKKEDFKIDKNDKKNKEFKDLLRLKELNEYNFKWHEFDMDKFCTIDFLITIILWSMYYEREYFHDPDEPAVDGIKVIKSVEYKTLETYILYAINSENDSSLSGALTGALAGMKEGYDYYMEQWMERIDKSKINKYLWE